MDPDFELILFQFSRLSAIFSHSVPFEPLPIKLDVSIYSTICHIAQLYVVVQLPCACEIRSQTENYLP